MLKTQSEANEMMTVKRMREELAKFPDDALCYAYEGEITGVIIVSKDKTADGDCRDEYLGEIITG